MRSRPIQALFLFAILSTAVALAGGCSSVQSGPRAADHGGDNGASPHNTPRPREGYVNKPGVPSKPRVEPRVEDFPGPPAVPAPRDRTELATAMADELAAALGPATSIDCRIRPFLAGGKPCAAGKDLAEALGRALQALQAQGRMPPGAIVLEPGYHDGHYPACGRGAFGFLAAGSLAQQSAVIVAGCIEKDRGGARVSLRVTDGQGRMTTLKGEERELPGSLASGSGLEPMESGIELACAPNLEADMLARGVEALDLSLRVVGGQNLPQNLGRAAPGEVVYLSADLLDPALRLYLAGHAGGWQITEEQQVTPREGYVVRQSLVLSRIPFRWVANRRAAAATVAEQAIGALLPPSTDGKPRVIMVVLQGTLKDSGLADALRREVEGALATGANGQDGRKLAVKSPDPATQAAVDDILSGPKPRERMTSYVAKGPSQADAILVLDLRDEPDLAGTGRELAATASLWDGLRPEGEAQVATVRWTPDEADLEMMKPKSQKPWAVIVRWGATEPEGSQSWTEGWKEAAKGALRQTSKSTLTGSGKSVVDAESFDPALHEAALTTTVTGVSTQFSAMAKRWSCDTLLDVTFSGTAIGPVAAWSFQIGDDGEETEGWARTESADGRPAFEESIKKTGKLLRERIQQRLNP